MHDGSKREPWMFATGCFVACFVLLTAVLSVETRWLQGGGPVSDAFLFVAVLTSGAVLLAVANVLFAGARGLTRLGRDS